MGGTNLKFQWVTPPFIPAGSGLWPGGDRKSDSLTVEWLARSAFNSCSYQRVFSLFASRLAGCYASHRVGRFHVISIRAHNPSHPIISTGSIVFIIFHYFSLFFHFCTSSCQSDIFYVVKCSNLRLTRHSNVSSWIYDIYGIPFRPRHLPAAAGSAGNVGNPLLPRKSERTHWFLLARWLWRRPSSDRSWARYPGATPS